MPVLSPGFDVALYLFSHVERQLDIGLQGIIIVPYIISVKIDLLQPGGIQVVFCRIDNIGVGQLGI